MTRRGGARGDLCHESHDGAGCTDWRKEGVITYEKMFLNDFVQLCHINAFFIMVICVFIANAKTTQAPDTTPHCLWHKWKERRTGKKAGSNWLTDWLIPADFQVFNNGKTTPRHTAPPQLGLTEAALSYQDLRGEDAAPCLNCPITTSKCGYKPLPPGLQTFQSHFGCVFIFTQSQPGCLDCSVPVENKLGFFLHKGMVTQSKVRPAPVEAKFMSKFSHVELLLIGTCKRTEIGQSDVCTKVSPSCFWLAPLIWNFSSILP